MKTKKLTAAEPTKLALVQMTVTPKKIIMRAGLTLHFIEDTVIDFDLRTISGKFNVLSSEDWNKESKCNRINF